MFDVAARNCCPSLCRLVGHCSNVSRHLYLYLYRHQARASVAVSVSARGVSVSVRHVPLISSLTQQFQWSALERKNEGVAFSIYIGF